MPTCMLRTLGWGNTHARISTLSEAQRGPGIELRHLNQGCRHRRIRQRCGDAPNCQGTTTSTQGTTWGVPCDEGWPERHASCKMLGLQRRRDELQCRAHCPSRSLRLTTSSYCSYDSLVTYHVPGRGFQLAAWSYNLQR